MEKNINKVNQNEKDSETQNHMPTFSTTLNSCVDLFFSIGASRTWDKEKLIDSFRKAFNENKEVALKILFYSRDVLYGQGERNTFRILIKWIIENYPEIVKKNIENIPEFGRWDDLFVLENTKLEKDMINLLIFGIESKLGLCCKWFPRQNSKTYPTLFNKVRKTLNVSPKNLRKAISASTNVVEQQMCSNNWDKIKYSSVPSIAMKNYKRSFSKHDLERFKSYIESLKKGEEKINAKAIFPHDIVGQFLNGVNLSSIDKDILSQQWNSLPNFMEGSKENILPMCDVSGSMKGLPMDVCIALGLYISERNESCFKDCFITFSSAPKIQQILGNTLEKRIKNLKKAEWEMSTNIESAFNVILEKALQFNVSEENMPTTILILSDMQFDRCTKEPNDSVYDMIKTNYHNAGYKLPKIVFWNLNSHADTPVRFTQKGIALVSGFSPSILTSLLGGKEFTPKSIMIDTIYKPRYDKIKI